MTGEQKRCVQEMRINGDSYAQIAERLDLSVNTIKSYCQRNHLGCDVISATDTPAFLCAHCGKPMRLANRPGKRFCSDACRMAWWKAHPGHLQRSAVYHFTCAICEKPFAAYGKANRKYCSRACYGQSKRAGV